MENALVPELEISDLRTSLDFYVNLIGFSIVYQRPEEGFAFLQLGAAQLMLDTVGMGRTFDGVADGLSGRGVNFQIEVTDPDHIVRVLADAEWPLFLPIEEKWYRRGSEEVGNRQFCVRDPDGYLLRLTRSLGARPGTVSDH
ncbi:bleomycin resistance protein [Martelella mediterranea]|uniref:Catechol 2,3-dioxygenase-like lactoylglutathione lyase family enzyme n=1 Tax=Martelella mediterranea TaxID=293089 RepID=A0A4V2V4P4_9HYPH|nr:VOC family protein [Martelella mediterranea]TCT41092.1 catechol 2,3-dioxygenase-like lactoylglutathione lyase family enzyme [Martelella mediterranea]